MSNKLKYEFETVKPIVILFRYIFSRTRVSRKCVDMNTESRVYIIINNIYKVDYR